MDEAPAPPRSNWRLALGPLLAVVVYLAPLDLPAAAHQLLAILVLALCYWVTEAVPAPVTALLAPMLCVLWGLGSIKAVLAPFGDPVVFLFIGSFMVAMAMQRYGLDHRLALALLAQRWAHRSPAGLLFALGLITCVLSLWISNTATTAMMLPIGLGVLAALGQGQPQERRRQRRREGTEGHGEGVGAVTTKAPVIRTVPRPAAESTGDKKCPAIQNVC